MQRLISKRNAVFLHNGMVEKHCRSAQAAQQEYAQLCHLREQGVAVPVAEPPQGGCLRMQFLAGETLPDFLQAPRSSHALQTAANALAGWFASFYCAVRHHQTGEIRGDVNGRNFLLHGGQVWGVDFEEKCYGDIEQDLGAILAFVSSYTLENTAQQRQMEVFLQQAFAYRMSVNMYRIKLCKQEELHKIYVRRRI